MKRLTLVQKFSLLCLGTLVVFGVGLGWIVTSSLEQTALIRSKTITASFVIDEMKKEFSEDDFVVPKLSSDYEVFSKRIKEISFGPSVVRIKLWNEDHMVIWSDEKRLVGRRFPDDEDLTEALGGEIVSEMKMLTKAENKFERQFERLIELYIPIRFKDQGDVVAVVEIYKDLDPLYADIVLQKRMVWTVIALGIACLYLILFGVVRSVSERIEAQTGKIRGSEERYRGLTQPVRDGAVSVDRGGKDYAAQRTWPIVGAVCFVILGLIFGLYEIIERTWLQGVDASVIHFLHILRGVGSAALVGIVITLYLWEERIPRLSDSLRDASAGPTGESFFSMRQGAEWFIGLRWIAFVIVTILVVVSTVGTELVYPRTAWIPLYICAALIGISNIVFLRMLNRRVAAQPLLLAQIVSDLALLTGLLHYSGGIENPFFLTFIFHITIASILLPVRKAYALTLLVCALFSTLALAEASQLIPHYTLELFPHGEIEHAEPILAHGEPEKEEREQVHAAHNMFYVSGIIMVFNMIAFGTAYFATSISEALRVELKREKETALMLLQAAKMAAIGELAGNIAHEINNPMGIIMGKTKLLLSDFKDQVPEKVYSDLGKIDRHTERVVGIVRGLLSFSRPSTKRKNFINMDSLIEESLSLMNARLRTEGITVDVSLDDDLPGIFGNNNELQQVFINLFSNAADAMPDGGELSIKAGPSATWVNGAMVEGTEIEVSDTGKGIAPENVEQVFTPFFSTKEQKGTGLGLSIVQGIIKDHGGNIRVESELEKGTTFTIFLPAGGK